MYIFLLSHPIQYFSPLFAYMAGQGSPLEVWYCNGNPQQQQYDAEFGQARQWDIPLLQGYSYRFFPNRGFTNSAKKGFFSLLNPGMVEALWRRKKSTLVIHSWQYASDWLAIIAAKLAGHRIVLWTEANGLHEGLQPKWKRLLKRFFLKTLLGAVSECWYIGIRNREFWQALGVPDTRLRFTPYAVDNDRFQKAAATLGRREARRQLRLPDEAFIILYSGKYIEKKRPLDLLQAFASLHHPEAFLVMVGEGRLRGEMEAVIADHGIADKLRLTGFVNQSEIPVYYRAADLLVMCSGLGETWGLSVNEAMNFSLPVIVSDLCGCSADLVAAGQNGFVFPTGSSGELASLLSQMIAMPMAERVAMGQRSLEIIERHHFSRILAAIEGKAGI